MTVAYKLIWLTLSQGLIRSSQPYLSALRDVTEQTVGGELGFLGSNTRQLVQAEEKQVKLVPPLAHRTYPHID